MNKENNKFKVEYSEAMKEFVSQKMAFTKALKNLLIAASFLIFLVGCGIGVLFYFKFISIALLLSIVFVPIFALMLVFTSIARKFYKTFKNGTFTARKIYVKESERVYQSVRLYKVITEDNETVFYMSTDILVELKPGTMLHLLESTKHNRIKMAINPVRQAS
jgi:hypothetical protein